METIVYIYSVSEGSLLYSYNTDKPFKAGSNWNESTNIYLSQNPLFTQVIPCSILMATQAINNNENENVQHLFVKPRYKEAYYKLSENFLSESINSIESFSKAFNDAPYQVKEMIFEKLKAKGLFNLLEKEKEDKETIQIKKGMILAFESVNLSIGTKNVWVSLIDSFNPIEKVVNEVVSVTVMADNILTEGVDTLDNIVFFAQSFKLGEGFTVRKPTENELNFFTKQIKEI